jgi:hypothetical protein
MNLIEHLKRQMVFSRAAFGPGQRTEGVSDHIRKELVEIAAEDAHHGQQAEEWVDVVILGLDGLWRSLSRDVGHEFIAEVAVRMIEAKQAINERRDWPDWRTAPIDKAIEHVRPEALPDAAGGLRR